MRRIRHAFLLLMNFVVLLLYIKHFSIQTCRSAGHFAAACWPASFTYLSRVTVINCGFPVISGFLYTYLCGFVIFPLSVLQVQHTQTHTNMYAYMSGYTFAPYGHWPHYRLCVCVCFTNMFLSSVTEHFTSFHIFPFHIVNKDSELSSNDSA